MEQQAQDRIHRLGQYKPIHVTRFIIASTIEERILKLQASSVLCRRVCVSSWVAGGFVCVLCKGSFLSTARHCEFLGNGLHYGTMYMMLNLSRTLQLPCSSAVAVPCCMPEARAEADG